VYVSAQSLREATYKIAQSARILSAPTDYRCHVDEVFL
jgi:hypothetical protein